MASSGTVSDLQRQILELRNELRELKESHNNLKTNHERFLTIDENDTNIITCNGIICTPNNTPTGTGGILCSSLSTTLGKNGGDIITGTIIGNYPINGTSLNDLIISTSRKCRFKDISDEEGNYNEVNIISNKSIVIAEIFDKPPN